MWWVMWCVMCWGTAHAGAAPSCPPPVVDTPAATRQAPPDQGLLWRVSRDGRDSYLFGTVHVGKPAWKRFGPRIRAALRQSDVLALELDPSDPSIAEGMAAAAPPPELPTGLQARLDAAFARACISAQVLAGLHPLLQATTLTVLEARWLGLDPLYAMEQLLLAQARLQGTRVVSLESAAQQVAALVPADAQQAQDMLEQSLQQLEDRSGRRVLRRVLRRLSQAWVRGDLKALEDYASWCECAANEEEQQLMRRMNDERNPALAAGIAAQHAQGARVFAAVGALHMTGPQALPRLLAQHGFKVERVKFSR
jgi:uncharacterized protein